MFKYILFDLDGTVTDSAEGITNSVKYALIKSGAEIPDYSVLKKFIGPPLINGFQDFCGFDKRTAVKAVEYYREYYREKGIFENSVYGGIVPLFEKLREDGKQIILATSKPELFAKQILEHFNLTEYFYDIVGATMDEKRTQKSEVISYVLEKNGITDKDSVIMIGDRHHDILGAKENGIKSLGVLYGFGDYMELKTAGADYTVNDVGSILEILI